MKPYYQDSYCTIYHGDCRDVLPYLGKVDLLLTDPPYGMDYQSSWRTDWQRKDKIIGDHEYAAWILDIAKAEIASFLWCRWDNLYTLPKPKSFIVWNKGAHSMGDLQHEFGRMWEACAFYPGPKHSFVYRPVDYISCPRVPAEKLSHPNEKPVGAIYPLIKSHTGNIIDPFMGSGTTLRAAKDLRRQAVGVEIEERYCEIAAKRLRQEVLALK